MRQATRDNREGLSGWPGGLCKQAGIVVFYYILVLKQLEWKGQHSSLRAIKYLNCRALHEELALGLTLLDSIVLSQSHTGQIAQVPNSF